MPSKFQEIKQFFKNYKHDGSVVKLDQCTTITDVDKFAQSSISALEANSGNKTMLPYYQRLLKVYKILIQNTIN